jgi:hypothetical protein
VAVEKVVGGVPNDAVGTLAAEDRTVAGCSAILKQNVQKHGLKVMDRFLGSMDTLHPPRQVSLRGRVVDLMDDAQMTRHRQGVLILAIVRVREREARREGAHVWAVDSRKRCE